MTKPRSPSRRSSATRRGLRIQPYIGFALLSLLVTALYGLTTAGAWRRHAGLGVLMTLITAAALVGLAREARTLRDARARPPLSTAALLDFAGVVVGAWVTYLLSVDLGLGPVTASALIGLAGGLVLPAQGAAIYCGSFAGMSSAVLLANDWEMLAAGVVAGAVYVLGAGTLEGFGGKLGTTAFVGTVVSCLGLQRAFTPAPVPEFALAWRIILSTTAGALATYGLSVPLNHGAVVGSSAVGLAAGLLLPALAPDTGPLIAVAVFAASFTGMSSPARVPGPRWMTLAGAITGFAFVLSLPVLGGAGGKLGTLALGASTAAWVIRTLLVERLGERTAVSAEGG